MPMMDCGCAAQGIDGNGNPVCVVHAIVDGTKGRIQTQAPDLEDRQARCGYDHGAGCPKNKGRDSRVSSAMTLAFFKYQPDSEYDDYYCGCWGWN